MAPRAGSLLRYSPALMVVAIVVADSINYADNDLWGRVRFGQAMIAAGHIIRTDPYSYSVAGHIWLDHEWLTEIIMAAVYNSLGVVGLKLFKLALTAATFVFLAMADAETGAPVPVQLAVLLTCAVSVSMQMQFRPQLFTFALLSALIFLLARDTYQRERKIRLWHAIPMFLLWGNLHGGFIAGLVALAVYATVSGVQEVWAGRGVGRACKLGAITAAAALATIVTPYGIGIWQFVLHALTNPLTRVAILDFQPFARALAEQWRLSPAGSVEYLCAIAMAAALVVALVLGPATDDLALVAVASMMTAAAVTSVRNVPIALITIAPPLTYHLALALRAGHVAINEPEPAVKPAAELRVRRWWIDQGVLYAAALALLLATGLFSNRLRPNDQYPAGAVRFMKSHGLHGNVLNSFDWGEYLIWHLEPGSKVFVDGRYDTVFPERVLNEMIAFNFNQPEVAQIHGADPRDFMLLPAAVASSRPVPAPAGWKLVYRDEYNRLYARPGSAAAGHPGVTVVIKQPGAAQVLDGYPHDYVLLRHNAPANQLMETRADWKLVYRDEYTRLYARAGSAAAQIPGVPVVGKAETTNFPW